MKVGASTLTQTWSSLLVSVLLLGSFAMGCKARDAYFNEDYLEAFLVRLPHLMDYRDVPAEEIRAYSRWKVEALVHLRRLNTEENTPEGDAWVEASLRDADSLKQIENLPLASTNAIWKRLTGIAKTAVATHLIVQKNVVAIEKCWNSQRTDCFQRLSSVQRADRSLLKQWDLSQSLTLFQAAVSALPSVFWDAPRKQRSEVLLEALEKFRIEALEWLSRSPIFPTRLDAFEGAMSYRKWVEGLSAIRRDYSNIDKTQTGERANSLLWSLTLEKRMGLASPLDLYSHLEKNRKVRAWRNAIYQGLIQGHVPEPAPLMEGGRAIAFAVLSKLNEAWGIELRDQLLMEIATDAKLAPDIIGGEDFPVRAPTSGQIEKFRRRLETMSDEGLWRLRSQIIAHLDPIRERTKKLALLLDHILETSWAHQWAEASAKREGVSLPDLDPLLRSQLLDW